MQYGYQRHKALPDTYAVPVRAKTDQRRRWSAADSRSGPRGVTHYAYDDNPDRCHCLERRKRGFLLMR
jgi:hypothetical protein